MTESPKSYLENFARQVGGELPADPTKAEASSWWSLSPKVSSTHIDRLREATGTENQ